MTYELITHNISYKALSKLPKYKHTKNNQPKSQYLNYKNNENKQVLMSFSASQNKTKKGWSNK